MTFPRFKSDILYALDLDGVIIDSIEECYQNCLMAYYESNLSDSNIKKLFYKYRGLVQPAYEFYFLMISIYKHLNNNRDINIVDIFSVERKKGRTLLSNNFEKRFFSIRRKLQKENLREWMLFNPLTKFGEYIKKEKPENVIIVTNKNVDSAKGIVDYYKISTKNIYGDDEVKDAGSKGRLLSDILNNSSLSKMIFIDDSIEHLDTVKNEKIKCYFADWGYGKDIDAKYETFKGTKIK